MGSTKHLVWSVLLGALFLAGMFFFNPGWLWPVSRPFLIQVVGPDGLPVAGIPVGLILDKGRLPEAWRLGFPIWQGVTEGDAGLVEVRFNQGDPILQLSGLAKGEMPSGPAEAFLGLPLAGAPSVKVDLSSPPAEPIRLRLPPTGKVRVRVAMEGGYSVAQDAVVSLIARSAANEDRASIPGGGELGNVRFDPGDNGDFVFEHVGLGLDLIVNTWTTAPVSDHAEGRGPSAAGETAEFALTLPEYPILVGRVLDGMGKPAKDMGFQGIFGWKGLSSPRLFQIGAGGEFRILIEPRFIGVRGARLVVTGGRDFLLEERIDYAETEIVGPLGAGEHTVGDLVLRNGTPDWSWIEPLAVGRVKDREGRPLEGVDVLVYERTTPLRKTKKGPWSDRRDLKVRSDAAGGFQIRGRTEERSLRLQAVSGELDCSAPIVAALGARALELVVYQAGFVEGSVLLDPGIPPEELALLVIPSGGGERSMRAIPGVIGPDGRFGPVRVPAGVVDLEVRVRDELLAAIESVDVPPGEASADPRLSGIDLRGRLRPIEVTLAAPSRWCQFWITVRNNGHSTFHRHSSGEPAVIYLGREPVDLLFEEFGFPPHLERGIAENRRIELDPGEAVVLRLDPADVLPGGAYRMEVGLERGIPGESEEIGRALLSHILPPTHARFDRAGLARLRVPRVGEHDLDLRLVFEGEGRIERRKLSVTPARIAAGRGEIALRTDPEALARAVEDLGNR